MSQLQIGIWITALGQWFLHKALADNLLVVDVRATGVELQEIPQLIIIYEIWLQPTSRRFLKELDEAPGGNNLYYILQCLRIPASVLCHTKV